MNCFRCLKSSSSDALQEFDLRNRKTPDANSETWSWMTISAASDHASRRDDLHRNTNVQNTNRLTLADDQRKENYQNADVLLKTLREANLFNSLKRKKTLRSKSADNLPSQVVGINTLKRTLKSKGSSDLAKTTNEVKNPTNTIDQKKKEKKQGFKDTEILLCVGGPSRRPEVFDTATEHWSDRVPPSAERSCPAAAALNGKVVVCGGKSCGQVLKTVEQYDPETNKWSQLASLRVARFGHALISLTNSLYALGGRDANRVLSSVECYETSSRDWHSEPHMLCKREGPAATQLQGGIVVAGGFDSKQLPMRSCEFYASPASPTSIAPLNNARAYAAAATYNTTVFVFGGNCCDSDAEQYDPISDRWTILCVKMSIIRNRCAAVCVCGNVYIIGGYDVTQFKDTNLVEVYDPIHKQMSTVSPLLRPRSSHAVASVSVKVDTLARYFALYRKPHHTKK